MNQEHIEKRLARLHGQSKSTREYVKQELARQEWWVKCWNCGKRVEGTPSDLAGNCPHCGVKLSGRQGT